MTTHSFILDYTSKESTSYALLRFGYVCVPNVILIWSPHEANSSDLIFVCKSFLWTVGLRSNRSHQLSSFDDVPTTFSLPFPFHSYAPARREHPTVPARRSLINNKAMPVRSAMPLPFIGKVQLQAPASFHHPTVNLRSATVSRQASPPPLHYPTRHHELMFA